MHGAQNRRLQCGEHGLGSLGLDTGLLDQVSDQSGLVENRLDGLDCYCGLDGCRGFSRSNLLDGGGRLRGLLGRSEGFFAVALVVLVGPMD